MKDKLILIALILFALFLRIYKLDAHGIWSDEKASINSSVGIRDPRCNLIPLPTDEVNLHKDLFSSKDYWEKDTLRNTVLATIRDNSGNSLFYTVILHYWKYLFGVSDYAFRFPSVIFGLLIIVVGYYFSREIFNSMRISIIAGALFSIHPLLIAYSQEVRGYSLAILATFLSSYLAIKIVNYKDLGDPPLRFYAAYVMAGIASLFSQFLTGYIFLAHAAFFLIFVRGKRRRHFVYAMIALFSLSFVLCFSLGLQEGLFMARGFHEGVLKTCSLAARTSFFTLIAGWTQVLLTTFGNYFQWFGFRVRQLAPTLLIPLVIIAICWRGVLKRTDYKHIIFLALLIIFAPIFATVASLRAHHILAFMPRYSTFSIPYAVILLALCADFSFKLSKIKRAIVLSLLSLQVIIMLVSIKITYDDIFNVYIIGGREPRQRNPYMRITNEIIRGYKDGDVVSYPTWEDAQLTNLYLKNYSYIVQKVDEPQIDKVILIKGKGDKKIELFNFEKGKYRY